MNWQVVDEKASEKGDQRRVGTNGRLLHCCCICGRLDTWGTSWSYFGSLKDLDDGAPVAKFCSEVCKAAGGRRAGRVTDDAKLAAKRAEWRPPTIVYREATNAEKYRIAVAQQRSGDAT